ASPAAPHQVLRNGKYYFRDGDMSRPARHREVEKMFASRQHGNLDMMLQLHKKPDELSLHITIENLSSQTAKNVGFRIKYIPVRNIECLDITKYFDAPLHQNQTWENTITIPYSSDHIYIQVETFGENLITKTKAAFVKITSSKTALLHTYFSEDINATKPDVFFETHKYLLD